jgi:NTP pyrophosphatase (non-canonical NTP hydrolase)
MHIIPDDHISFEEYQIQAHVYATYPNRGSNLVYPALGLVGEAGEVAEKIKKLWRNRNITSAHVNTGITGLEVSSIVSELGDVLWYISALAIELQVDLNLVAMSNLAKLQDRVNRGVIKGEGDNR